VWLSASADLLLKLSRFEQRRRHYIQQPTSMILMNTRLQCVCVPNDVTFGLAHWRCLELESALPAGTAVADRKDVVDVLF